MNTADQVKKIRLIKRHRGVVVSTKMAGVAVVRVSSSKQNKKYHKRYTVDARYKAANPKGKYATGDSVMIEESRPLSRDTRWRIIRKI